MFGWLTKGLSEFTDWYARHGFRKFDRLLGGASSSWSGENVNEATALNHSVVWACKRRISECVAMLPLSLMQSTDKGSFPFASHAMYGGLKYSPNAEMTAMSFRESLTGHSLMQGNCYARIFRRSGSGEANELWPLMPEQVTQDREKSGRKRLVYIVKEGNSPSIAYTVTPGKNQEILHVPGMSYDGIFGYSVLTMARQSFGTAIATERNVGRFFGNGGRVPYNLKLNQKFPKDQDFDKFRSDWEAIYNNPHKVPILEPWFDYEQTGLSMADSQMLESRQFGIPEVCRWFLLSPHLVGDLSRATFSNIEHLSIEFVNYTLMPWLKRWEDNLWRCVLTSEEKSKGLYFKHNVNALLRGDFLARMQGYTAALQNGYFNIDEVRDLEDLNALPNGAGKAHHIQLNMATVPGTGEPMISEQGILAKISQSTEAVQ